MGVPEVLLHARLQVQCNLAGCCYQEASRRQSGRSWAVGTGQKGSWGLHEAQHLQGALVLRVRSRGWFTLAHREGMWGWKEVAHNPRQRELLGA